MIRSAIPRLRLVVAALLVPAAASDAASATNLATSPLSEWRAGSLAVAVSGGDKAPPPPSAFSPLLTSAGPLRDLQLSFQMDLPANTRIEQRHGIEFTTRDPLTPAGLPPVDSDPLVRSSGTTLRYAPMDRFDIAVGTTLRQSVEPGGLVPWETFTHALTLGSNPAPDTRFALTLRENERVESAAPERGSQGLGLQFTQKLPAAPLRLTLAPEWREASAPAPPGTPEASGSRLAGSVAWDFAPGAVWSIGSDIDRSGDDTALVESQSLNSTVQLRPVPDVGLSLATRYAETRRDAPDIPNASDPERDLRLRLTPSVSLGQNITAQMDFDLNFREAPVAPGAAEAGGAVSFSIRGRF